MRGGGTRFTGGTGNDQVFGESGAPASVMVDGLATKVSIGGAEVTYRLIVQGLDGDDVLDGSALAAGAISLTLVTATTC